MYVMRRWLRTLVLTTLMGAPPVFASGCAGTTRGGAVLVVRTPPPPPPRRTEVVRTQTGSLWVPGHWVRRGARWTWQEGYWVQDRPGYTYVPGRWVREGNRWYWQEPYWRGADRRDRRERDVRYRGDERQRERDVRYRGDEPEPRVRDHRRRRPD